MAKTKKIKVTFEVDAAMTPDWFHETLCKMFHEGMKAKDAIANEAATPDVKLPEDWMVDVDVKTTAK